MTENVLIIGDTPWSRRIEKDLASLGIQAVLETATVTKCQGGINDFTVSFCQNGKTWQQKAAAVVIAEDGKLRPTHEDFSLTLSPAVRSLSDMQTGELPESFSSGSSAVFLHGLTWESPPATTQAVMDAAISLAQDRGVKTYILTGNLKVARNGLEKRFRQAREAGVVFVKFTQTPPDVQQTESGVRIAFTDPVARIPFTLTPDLIVVDERFCPSPALRALKEAFRLHADPAGFLQADNVHRFSVETNRKGVFVAGPARGLQAQDDQMADADAAVAAVISVLEGQFPEAAHQAEINRNQCVRCFTCYRVCPHRAVLVSPTRLDVMPGACAGCGLCAAECPRGAIRFDPFSPSKIAQQITAARKPDSRSPFIVAFLCSRSAVPARDQAINNGWTAPDGLFCIEVPCAGAVSTELMFAAIQARADGVLVLSCHPDNCSSQEGTIHAQQKVAEIRSFFSMIGQPEDRIESATLAANMGAGFIQIMDEFHKRIAGSGGSQ